MPSDIRLVMMWASSSQAAGRQCSTYPELQAFLLTVPLCAVYHVRRFAGEIRAA